MRLYETVRFAIAIPIIASLRHRAAYCAQILLSGEVSNEIQPNLSAVEDAVLFWIELNMNFYSSRDSS